MQSRFGARGRRSCATRQRATGCSSNLKQWFYIEAAITKGRHHQIRRHFAGTGHPLILDEAYGNEKANAAFSRVPLPEILPPACARISFHPYFCKPQKLVDRSAPLPNAFPRRVLTKLKSGGEERSSLQISHLRSCAFSPEYTLEVAAVSRELFRPSNMNDIERQGKADMNFYFVVDLHALTTVPSMRTNIPQEQGREAVLDLLACGFDPAKAILFYQSDVPMRMRNRSIPSTVSPMGTFGARSELQGKSGEGISASVGLFTYPVPDGWGHSAVQCRHSTGRQKIRSSMSRLHGSSGEVQCSIRRDIHALLGTAHWQGSICSCPARTDRKMSKSYGNTDSHFRRGIGDQKGDHGYQDRFQRSDKTPKIRRTASSIRFIVCSFRRRRRRSWRTEYKNGLSGGDAKKRLFETYLEYFGPMRGKSVPSSRRSPAPWTTIFGKAPGKPLRKPPKLWRKYESCGIASENRKFGIITMYVPYTHMNIKTNVHGLVSLCLALLVGLPSIPLTIRGAVPIAA